MIQVLANSVIDQIAAGEVIERPAQLVKELVENSIDAGAKNISVEFSDGGREIKVTDDGVGILAHELDKALDRHATSKIVSSEDLWRLHSFGFRGEALASISAVSKLSLKSKPAGQKTAAQIISEFGERHFYNEVGGEQGTIVQVEKLFENVPARLKFLKSAAAETTQIKAVLKALALSHHEISFRVISDGEVIFIWPATTDRMKRVEQVLNVTPLYSGQAQREGVTAYSVFADPNTTAKTSKNMWFFAQGRWVQDRTMQAAVIEAYRQLLMHGEFPICVTWVEAPPDQIDVNIHPTKSQVKFLDPSLVFRAVQASVRDTLEKAPWLANMPLQKTISDSAAASSLGLDAEANKSFSGNLKFSSQEFEKTQYQQKPSLFQFQKQADIREDLFSKLQEKPAESIDSPQLQTSDEPFLESRWGNLQILAQAHLTYIVAQSANGMMFVDQHAAHERVLFEKLMKSWLEGGLDIQDFLFPLAFDLSQDQVDALMSIKTELEKMGLFLEQLGPETIGIKAAPSILKESSLPQILESTAQEISQQGGSFIFENKLSHLCATMACHSAIRAGQALSTEEMQTLLKSMDDFPLSSFCPHGRPVFVEYSFAKLEKDFGRTVT
jgi:DNA mismatch repair protein MutL